MEANFTNLQDNIVYHSNIFNYDKQFLMTLLKNGIKINFSEFAQATKANFNDLNLVLSYLKLPSKDQIELMTYAFNKEFGHNEEDINEEIVHKKGLDPKSVRKTLRILFNLLYYSFQKAEENSKKEENGINKIGEYNTDNLCAVLLFIDGISMVNIDLIRIIKTNALNTGHSLKEITFDILNSNFIDFHIKEIASHILSIALMQSDGLNSDEEKEEDIFENSKNLMKWTYEQCIQKNRDSCLTSNLSLLLTMDNNIEYFLVEFNLEYPCIRKLFELMTEADININIIYEALLCMWNISSNQKYFYFFEKKENKYIEKIVQVIRTNKIDKVARIGLMTLKNLLDSQICVEILFDIKFMQTVSILLTNKWNDPIIKELLNYCLDYLEKNYKSMKLVNIYFYKFYYFLYF